MQVCVLGPLLIQADGSEVPAGSRLQRRVLARLAMDGGRPVSVDDLEQAVWGDDPPSSARHTIATHVFRLRRLGLVITTRDDRYVLETPTDVDELERVVAASNSALEARDLAGAAQALRQTVSMWRGQPLVDIDDLPEARIVATRLEELVDRLREDLLAIELDEGHAAELVGLARQLADEQPYRERRWELLMLALYRAGRQADALDAYAECRRRLLDDLGLDPGTSLRRMQQAVLAQDPALEPPSAATTSTAEDTDTGHRVPGTSTRLIGRTGEQADLAEVWERARLVTLLGPPGAGKTRLALELAREAPAPVWFIALEELPESRSVAAAILDAVAPSSRAADASQGVATALGSAPGLLVLDGCEGRQAEVGREVGRLLESCPGIRIVATSRERLGLLDEAVIPIGPLAAGDAIDLLVDRARFLDPHFRLAPNDVALADRLCALVDRLPLGLELVARHLQLLRLDEVVERVESDLGRWAGGPVGGRAGLWAALDASVERLGPEERQTLLALAVMVADADLSLIAAVAGFTGDGVDSFEVVARLVDASLVQVRSVAGPTRYELLRTLAGRTLETSAEADVATARTRYMDTVLARAAELNAHLAGAERSDTLRLLDREMPHVRAVLDALIGAPGDIARTTLGLEVAVALTDYWLGRHPAEGLDWLTRLIEVGDPRAKLRAEALLAVGHLCYWVTDFAHGDEIVAEAQALFASLGDPLGEGRALRRRGAIANATDDLPRARALLEASLARLEEAGVEKEIGTTLLHLGSLLADEGLADAARPALERSLAIANRTGDPLAKGHVLAALTLSHWKGGDLEAAMQTGNEALLIFRELGHSPTEGTVAYRLAAVARGLNRPRAAHRYAQLAIDAGERASTRTTIALGHVNLARLDIDSGEFASAAGHLLRSLELIDPDSDRWVLADALEATARLLVAVDRSGAKAILTSAGAIRVAIQQPVPPTEAADLDRTSLHAARVDVDEAEALDPAAALALAAAYLREVPKPAPARIRHAKG
jgi:DNA-binding SARP family transcriptional activator/predicted ATPase